MWRLKTDHAAAMRLGWPARFTIASVGVGRVGLTFDMMGQPQELAVPTDDIYTTLAAYELVTPP